MRYRTRQAASNFEVFGITLVDSTAGALATGGTQVPVPDSAKIYITNADETLVNGVDCVVEDNGDGTIDVSYRAEVEDLASDTRVDIVVQFEITWPDDGGVAVKRWVEPETWTLMPNLA